MGNINKIVTTLTERPYGKYHFKAYRMMREGLLLAGLLTNAKSWINMTKKDIEELEKPDLILMRNVLSVTGNPSKVFMMLELGIIPVRFVIMKKRMQFLHYILNESTESMIRKVYDTLKQDYRNGDFVSQTNSDRITLDINLDDSEIRSFSKGMWKNVIDKKIKSVAFEYLVEENLQKENTKDILFKSLDMSGYLKENKRKSLSHIIFQIRSKTLNIKEFQPWNYTDNLCVKCEIFSETFDHFANCKAYQAETEGNWKDIFKNYTERQFRIAEIIEIRLKIRQEIIDKQEDGLASADLGSTCSNVL